MKWRLRHLITATFCLALVGSLPAQADDIEQVVENARKYFVDEQYEKVIEVLEDMCARDSTMNLAHTLLGHAYHRLGRHDDARVAFARAITQEGLSTDALDGILQIDLEQGREHTLLAGLGLRMLISPTNTECALSYANALTLNERNSEAEQVCAAILDRTAECSPAFLCLGNSYLASGNDKGAVEAFETAYYLGNTNAGLASRIAELWYSLGDTREALRWYDRAIEQPPDDVVGLQLRAAELRMASGDYKKAIATLDPLTESSDAAISGKALLILGRIAAQRDQDTLAVDCFRKAIDKGVVSSDIVTYVLAYLIRQEQYEEAADIFETYRSSLPFNLTLARSLISGLIRTRQPQRAEKLLLNCIEHTGLDSAAESFIGQLSRD